MACKPAEFLRAGAADPLRARGDVVGDPARESLGEPSDDNLNCSPNGAVKVDTDARGAHDVEGLGVAFSRGIVG